MRKGYRVLIVTLALLLAISSVAAATSRARGIEAASESCVAIAWPGSNSAFALAPSDIVGSGVVVDDELVLTAAHVVSDQLKQDVEILVQTEAGSFTGTIVGEPDDARDLALLSVPGLPNPPIEWGDSTALTHGQEVYSLGFPLGFEDVNVTRGIVSSPSQKVDGSIYVVTDTSINPGNSGGALVDSEGRLLGINVAAMEGYGDMGLTVPGADARAYVSARTSGGEDDASRGAGIGTRIAVALGAGAAIFLLLALATVVSITALVRSSSPGLRWRPYVATAGGSVLVAGVVLAVTVGLFMTVLGPERPSAASNSRPTRASLQWDSDVDVDLLIFDETGEQPLLASWFVCGPDIQDGSGAEYFDFQGYDEVSAQTDGPIDLSSGTYIVAAYYCDRPESGPAYEKVDVTLTLTTPGGETSQRTKSVGWEPGTDVWQAFEVDAHTGAIVDVDEFVLVEGLYE